MHAHSLLHSDFFSDVRMEWLGKEHLLRRPIMTAMTNLEGELRPFSVEGFHFIKPKEKRGKMRVVYSGGISLKAFDMSMPFERW
jgi:hypothetical protein